MQWDVVQGSSLVDNVLVTPNILNDLSVMPVASTPTDDTMSWTFFVDFA